MTPHLEGAEMTPRSQAAHLTDLLHRGRPGFVELVAATRSPEGRLLDFRRGHFVRAGHRGQLLATLGALGGGARVELFLTPATHSRPVSGNESVTSLAVAWVDIDDPDRLADLRRFAHRPHAVVASGSGGAHAYWLLDRPLAPAHGESVNRRLAAALGGDLASANRGRILRVPGSRNFKATAPGEEPRRCRLVLLEPSRRRHRPSVLVGGLADPKEPRPARAAATVRGGATARPWEGLEAADYYRLLTGLEPGRDGTVGCPNLLHEDRHPSAHLYPDGRGWFCFACGAGGGAVDMVAALRGWPTGAALRGERFIACAEELRRLLGARREPEQGARGGRRPAGCGDRHPELRTPACPSGAPAPAPRGATDQGEEDEFLAHPGPLERSRPQAEPSPAPRPGRGRPGRPAR